MMNIPLAIFSQIGNRNLLDMAPPAHPHRSGPVLTRIYHGKISDWDDEAIKQPNQALKPPDQKIVEIREARNPR